MTVEQHNMMCTGCLVLSLVERAEKAEAEAHDLQHDVDRIRERKCDRSDCLLRRHHRGPHELY